VAWCGVHVIFISAPNRKGSRGGDAVYSKDDLKAIVCYALERGIRMIPEWEMPGHSYGFGMGYPFMMAHCPNYTTDVNAIPLNIASDRVYELLFGFMDEMTAVFPDEFIHTGGDEVVVDCWINDPEIKKWGEDHNLTNPYHMFQYFEMHLGTLVWPTNRSSSSSSSILHQQQQQPPPYINHTMVVWQDVYNDNWQKLAHKEMIVEVWLDQGTIASVVNSGYRTIWAYPWYLDQQSPGMSPKPEFYLWGDTWKAFYVADPTKGLNLKPEQEKMVLGGEGCMWGEQVDAHNIDSRIWPRASAIAE